MVPKFELDVVWVFFCPSPPLKDIECMAGKTVCIEQLFPMRLGIMFFLLTFLSPKPSKYLGIGLEKKKNF